MEYVSRDVTLSAQDNKLTMHVNGRVDYAGLNEAIDSQALTNLNKLEYEPNEHMYSW